MEKDIYFKQSKLFNPHKTDLKVFVYGAGSIGSHVTIGLAKIGVTDITVFDYDIVEDSNVPAQFFATDQAGKMKYKTDALKEIVKYMTGTDITVWNLKIDNGFAPETSINSIHILAFDNIEARQLVAKKLEGYPVFLIDGRIGGFNFEKYVMKANSEKYPVYLKTLEGSFAELECGEKCLWTVNSILASKIIADVIKISQDKIPSEQMKSHALADITISGELK